MKYFLEQYKKAFMMGVMSKKFSELTWWWEDLKTIIENMNNDWTLNEKEKEKLKWKNLEALKKAYKEIKDTLSDDVKNWLSKLIEELEKNKKNPEYWMEWLRNAIPKKSAFWKILNYNIEQVKNMPKGAKESLNLEGKTFFDYWIIVKLSEKMEYKDAIELSDKVWIILWKKVLSKMWIGSATSFVVNPIMEKFKSISEKVWSIWKKDKEESKDWDTDSSFWLWDMKGVFDWMEDFDSEDEAKSESFKLPGIWEVKIPKWIWKLVKYLDSLVETNFDNLNELIVLAKKNQLENSSDFKNLLDNPVILEEVLEKGVYKKNWFNIDLKEWKIILWTNNSETIKKAKDNFMKETIELTKKTGAPIDWFLWMFKEAAGIFKKIWIDSSEIKDFVEWLYEIPIIWALLKILFWSFFDWVGEELEKSEIKDKYKKIVTNLEKFIKKSKIEDLPFKLNKIKDWKEKLDKDDFDNINKFLKKIEKQEKNQKISESILKDTDILGKLLTEEVKNTDSDFIKQIKNKILELKKAGEKPSKKDFFEALAKITFKEEEKTSPQSSPVWDETASKEADKENTEKQQVEEKAEQAKIVVGKKQIETDKNNIKLERAWLIESKRLLENDLIKLGKDKKTLNEKIKVAEEELNKLGNSNKAIEKEIGKIKKTQEPIKNKIEEYKKAYFSKEKELTEENKKNNELNIKIEKLKKLKEENSLKILNLETDIWKHNDWKIYWGFSKEQKDLEKNIEETKWNINIIDEKLWVVKTKEKEVVKKSNEIKEKEEKIELKKELDNFEKGLKNKKLEEIEIEKTGIEWKIQENEKKISEIKEKNKILVEVSNEGNLEKLDKLTKIEKGLKEENKILITKKEITEKIIKEKKEGEWGSFEKSLSEIWKNKKIVFEWKEYNIWFEWENILIIWNNKYNLKLLAIEKWNIDVLNKINFNWEKIEFTFMSWIAKYETIIMTNKMLKEVFTELIKNKWYSKKVEWKPAKLVIEKV